MGQGQKKTFDIYPNKERLVDWANKYVFILLYLEQPTEAFNRTHGMLNFEF